MSSHVTGVVYADGETVGSVEGNIYYYFDTAFFGQIILLVVVLGLIVGFTIYMLRDILKV